MNISFGSTYKVTTANKENSFEKFGEFNKLCYKKANTKGVSLLLEDKFIDTNYMESPKYEATRTIIAPSSMDNEIEMYCLSNGIKFTKYSSAELLDGRKILNRIAEAPKGYKTVFVNVDKLNNYLKNQESNIEHCENDNNKYYYHDVANMIKSGSKIPASTMYICGNGQSTKDVVDYVKKFGKDNLNENQVVFSLQQTTIKPDHCTFFALKNHGIKNIPVYVDKNSYEVGKALDLF